MEAIALYDYEAQQEGQLSIKKGDTITNVKKVCSGNICPEQCKSINCAVCMKVIDDCYRL